MSSFHGGCCTAPRSGDSAKVLVGVAELVSGRPLLHSSECIIVSHPLIIRKFIAALGKCHFTAVAWNKSVFCSELAPSAHRRESLAKSATGFIYAQAY